MTEKKGTGMTGTDEAIGLETDEGQGERMTDAAAALVDYAGHKDFGRDVEEIIARVIETVTPTERLKQLSGRLGAYFDNNDKTGHALLLLVAFPPEETEELVPISEVASDEEAYPLRTVVRRISGLFGADVSDAFGASEFEPDNWANLELRYAYLPSVDMWRAELEMIKFDETRARIDGPVKSFLRMVNYLLAELTRMPAEAHAFAEELEEFRVIANDFLDQYE